MPMVFLNNYAWMWRPQWRQNRKADHTCSSKLVKYACSSHLCKFTWTFVWQKTVQLQLWQVYLNVCGRSYDSVVIAFATFTFLNLHNLTWSHLVRRSVTIYQRREVPARRITRRLEELRLTRSTIFWLLLHSRLTSECQ